MADERRGRWDLAVQVTIGVILTILGWSLQMNINAFGRKLDEVASNVSQLTASVAGHANEIGQLKVRVGSVENKVEKIEDRERSRLAGGR